MADQMPVLEMAIEARSIDDHPRLLAALHRLASEDPSFRVTTDEESGQTIIKGMGESHLDIKVDMLGRIHKVAVNVGAPQVAFRERITRRVEVDYVNKEQTGGTDQFARVKLVVEPNEPGKGFAFESGIDRARIIGGAVPKEYIASVEKGLRSVLGAGVVAGFPVVDVKVALIDGACHEVDSSALAFEIASRAAFREALQKGGSVLIEPIMKVEVMTPLDCAAEVVADLRRRGRTGPDVTQAREFGDDVLIIAGVALANLLGYAAQLRLITGRRGTFATVYSHYAETSGSSGGDDTLPPAVGLRA